MAFAIDKKKHPHQLENKIIHKRYILEKPTYRIHFIRKQIYYGYHGQHSLPRTRLLFSSYYYYC